MPPKRSFPLKNIQDELHLTALIHFDEDQRVIESRGNDTLVNALIKSNLLAVIQSDIAMPIRLANNEIYEMVLKNNRGLVAKEGRANRYLVALRMDLDNTIAAIGDDLDPGIVLFEMLQFNS